jgi:hypothetical protein
MCRFVKMLLVVLPRCIEVGVIVDVVLVVLVVGVHRVDVVRVILVLVVHGVAGMRGELRRVVVVQRFLVVERFGVHGFLMQRRVGVKRFVVLHGLVVHRFPGRFLNSVLLHGGRLRRHGGRNLRRVAGFKRLRRDDVVTVGGQGFLPGPNFLARQLTSGVTEFLT